MRIAVAKGVPPGSSTMRELSRGGPNRRGVNSRIRQLISGEAGMANFCEPPSTATVNDVWLQTGEKIDLGLWGGGKGSEVLVVSIEDATLLAMSSKPTAPDALWISRFTLTALRPGSTTLRARDSAGTTWTSLQVTVPDVPQEFFIKKLVAEGGDVARQYKLPLSIMVAQACLESANGASGHARNHNILFGIAKRVELSKGQEPDWYPACKKENIVLAPTKVVRKGPDGKDQEVVVNDRFCGASSYKEAVEIWAQYVTEHPASQSSAHLFKDGPWTDDELAQIAALLPRLNFGNNKTRATYGQDVMRIVDQLKLRRFDPQ
jgi:hypothetical protein